jgi:hypothetical protein
MYKEMGRQGKDTLTGFVGTVAGYAQYISGCHQVLLTGKSVKGEEAKSCWIDEQRITFTGKALTLDNSKTPGFGPAAPKR